MTFSVHKFGGSVLATMKGFENLRINILNSSSKNAVIFSAIGKTSSELRNAIYLAEKNELEESDRILNNIENVHNFIAEKILDESSLKIFIEEFSKILNNCRLILKSVSITNEVSGRTYDRFLACGEDMAAELVKIYLNENQKNYLLDARKIIKTDSDFTNAKINSDETFQALNLELMPLFEIYQNVFIQGFVGSDKSGITTTMGFESSNLTATIIADFLNAQELTLWSDVDGIYSADPSDFSSARLINHLDYKTALNAGLAGLKLIYPEMIRIAESKKINLIYRNGNDFTDNFSFINNREICFSTLYILTEATNDFPDNEKVYKSVVIINPQKNIIIEFLMKYYSIEIQRGDVVIQSGFSNEKMKIICKDANIAKSIIDGLIKI
jgi:aspartate kinase